jgi:hypothetical protein
VRTSWKGCVVANTRADPIRRTKLTDLKANIIPDDADSTVLHGDGAAYRGRDRLLCPDRAARREGQLARRELKTTLHPVDVAQFSQMTPKMAAPAAAKGGSDAREC